MDAAFSAFWYCPGYCDIVKIKEEYAIADHNFPRKDGYNYKYAMDLDGNSFSGRFLGLLGSGSLVFKVTSFVSLLNQGRTNIFLVYNLHRTSHSLLP